jgi:hypothetical protein
MFCLLCVVVVVVVTADFMYTCMFVCVFVCSSSGCVEDEVHERHGGEVRHSPAVRSGLCARGGLPDIPQGGEGRGGGGSH